MLLKSLKKIFQSARLSLRFTSLQKQLKKAESFFREYQLFNEKFQNFIFTVSFSIYFSSYANKSFTLVNG